MEDILIMVDEKGGFAILTTDSPMSRHGIPVLRVKAEGIDGDLGPADLIGERKRPEMIRTAAGIVAEWIRTGKHTEEELEASTVRSELSMLHHFSEEFKGKAIQDITQRNIEKWKIKKKEDEYKDSTINRELALIKGIFRKA